MPTPLSAAQAAAAGSLVDNIFALIDQGIELVGEDNLTALINEKLDIPYLPESAEAVLIGFVVKKIHAVVHKNQPAPPAGAAP